MTTSTLSASDAMFATTTVHALIQSSDLRESVINRDDVLRLVRECVPEILDDFEICFERLARDHVRVWCEPR